MVPWWGKIGAKLVLSRLPVPYSVWRRVGVFRHGAATDPVVALRTFRSLWEPLAERKPEQGFSMLELGPGDSLLSAAIAFVHGAGRSVLVDRGRYAEDGPELYVALDAELARQGLPNSGAADAQDPLEAVHGTYLTEGLDSLRGLPSGSFDWIWSNAVLEHIAVDEMPALLAEFRRLLRTGGVTSHQVDFRDHLGGGLNNLRFSRAIWESRWWREAGFYTNRIAPSELGAMFEAAGFTLRIAGESRRAALPMPRSSLAAEFRERSEDDLLVEGRMLHAW